MYIFIITNNNNIHAARLNVSRDEFHARLDFLIQSIVHQMFMNNLFLQMAPQQAPSFRATPLRSRNVRPQATPRFTPPKNFGPKPTGAEGRQQSKPAGEAPRAHAYRQAPPPPPSSSSLSAEDSVLKFINKDRTTHLAKSDDAHAILGVAPNATQEEIKKAAKKAKLATHPDKNHGNEELAAKAFKLVSEAASQLGQ